ncbi:hypothetical protein COJ79_15335 [Bacillus thuringiensis]|nr:hypothetical protein COJ79_15335 [Bacillus thuringiensis]RHW05729.1 hypothetical protein B7P27_26940 [Bacillus cereus]
MYVYIGNVKIRNRFFLLVEIEVEVGNVAIEEFVFIRISEQEARTLLVGGIYKKNSVFFHFRGDFVELA